MSNVLVYIRSVSYGLYDAEILRGFPGFLISRIFPYCPDLRIIHTARQQNVPDFRICVYLNHHRQMSMVPQNLFLSMHVWLQRNLSLYVYCLNMVFHTSCSNIKKTDEADRSMTDIFKFHMGCFPGNYRFIRIFVFQCLNACHFIHGDCMSAIFMDCLCFVVTVQISFTFSAKVSGESVFSEE